MLGNPSVTAGATSRAGAGSGQASATAADIAGLGEDHYLDLNSEVLGDACVYARELPTGKEEGRARAATYAQISREPGHPGFALQYWFFWYFNQFNDLHEGDWRGCRSHSRRDSRPRRGGDRTRSSSSSTPAASAPAGARQDAEGGHPPDRLPGGRFARDLLRSAVYVENGQEGSGLGCDVTAGPARIGRGILLPDHVADRVGRLAQLLRSLGRTREGANNGPTGPQTKRSGRNIHLDGGEADNSPRLPGGSSSATRSSGFLRRRRRAPDLSDLDVDRGRS